MKTISNIAGPFTSSNIKNVTKNKNSVTLEYDLKGESFSKSNVRCIRPGYGLPTICYDKILKLRRWH